MPGPYPSITLGNVTYSGLGAPLTIGPDFNGSFNTTGGKSLFNDVDHLPAVFRFDFATSVNAFGFNWGAADNTWLLAAFDSGGGLIESLVVHPNFDSSQGEFFGMVGQVLFASSPPNVPSPGTRTRVCRRRVRAYTRRDPRAAPARPHAPAQTDSVAVIAWALPCSGAGSGVVCRTGSDVAGCTGRAVAATSTSAIRSSSMVDICGPQVPEATRPARGTRDRPQ
jgi:hypothetical protein